MLDFFKGKKTYLTMIVIIVLAGINGWNEYCHNTVPIPTWCINVKVPDWIFAVLASLGIYTRTLANK